MSVEGRRADDPAGGRGTSQRLIEAHQGLWAAATTAPFLEGTADGTLDPAAFDRWLEQDHRFVVELTRAWGLLVRSAPESDLQLLVGGMAAFADEAAWMRGVAAERGLDLDVEPLPETVAYSAALHVLAAEPYPVAITAMWAVEAAYLAAWQGALPGHPTYREFVTHWADDGFAAFVTDLAAVVDRELPDGPTPEATAAFTAVAGHESAFWSMTTG